jgi:hypothetical protein
MKMEHTYTAQLSVDCRSNVAFLVTELSYKVIYTLYWSFIQFYYVIQFTVLLFTTVNEYLSGRN